MNPIRKQFIYLGEKLAVLTAQADYYEQQMIIAKSENDEEFHAEMHAKYSEVYYLIIEARNEGKELSERINTIVQILDSAKDINN